MSEKSHLGDLRVNESDDARLRLKSMIRSWFRSIPRKYAEMYGPEDAEARLATFARLHRPIAHVMEDEDISVDELLGFLAVFDRRMEARHVAI